MNKKLSPGSLWGVLTLALLNVLIFTFVCYAFPPRGHKWKVHDMSRPTPAVVTPGTFSTQNTPGQPPSDAIVIFDGKDLTNWRSMDGSPAKWKVENGYMESVKAVVIFAHYKILAIANCISNGLLRHRQKALDKAEVIVVFS